MTGSRQNRRPFIVVPGGDRGITLLTARGLWASEAVASWIMETAYQGVIPKQVHRDHHVYLQWLILRDEALDFTHWLRERAADTEGEIPPLYTGLSEAIERALNMQIIPGAMQGLTATADTRPTLYFIHASGCEACEMAKPEVGAFWRANKNRVKVVPVDLTRAEWKAKKWEPDATPTLIVRYADGRLSKKLEGYERGAFLKWIREVLP